MKKIIFFMFLCLCASSLYSDSGFIIFEDSETFNSWHADVITILNLPKIGVNAATGREEPGKQQTLYYTSSYEHPEEEDDRICSYVDDTCPENKLIGLSLFSFAEIKVEGWFPEYEP